MYIEKPYLFFDNKNFIRNEGLKMNQFKNYGEEQSYPRRKYAFYLKDQKCFYLMDGPYTFQSLKVVKLGFRWK